MRKDPPRRRHRRGKEVLQWSRNFRVAERGGIRPGKQGKAGLQWSRNFRVAERGELGVGGGDQRGLQWSRNFRVAESKLAGPDREQFLEASMEPQL